MYTHHYKLLKINYLHKNIDEINLMIGKKYQ